jgi:hypothetical protein
MSRLNPIWTAGRLNEALAKAEGSVVVEFGPDGEIETLDLSSTVSPRVPDWQRQLLQRRRGVGALLQPIVATHEFDAGWRELPPLLAFLSINPEPWCAILAHAGDLELVGPFLDYPSPLWEWLVRAARAGHARIFPRWPGIACKDYRLDERTIPLPELVHGEHRSAPPWLRSTLDDFELSRAFTNVKSDADATAVTAGLMELHDFAESHELAQSIEGRGRNRAGDYWHAIHHRREPDIANAKYWIRKVGEHPIHEALAAATGSLLSPGVLSNNPTELDTALKGLTPKDAWDPFAFADLCEQAVVGGNSELVWAARRIQFLEMTLLLHCTYEDAIS